MWMRQFKGTRPSISRPRAAQPAGTSMRCFTIHRSRRCTRCLSSTSTATSPPDDDLTVTMTDFRIDDLYNHGGGTGALNVPIEGIGRDGVETGAGQAEYGSSRLQTAVGPIYLGPRFQDKPKDDTRTYRKYAVAAGGEAGDVKHPWVAWCAACAVEKPETLAESDT